MSKGLPFGFVTRRHGPNGRQSRQVQDKTGIVWPESWATGARMSGFPLKAATLIPVYAVRLEGAGFAFQNEIDTRVAVAIMQSVAV